MKRFNHHTHSCFCDGSADPEEYVKEAIRLGFSTLGFSSHAPVPFKNTFALKEERRQEYRQVIRALQAKYAGQIEIYLGLEIDFIPGLTREFEFLRNDTGLDFVIGGIHLVKKEDGDGGLWYIDGPNYQTYDIGLKEVFHDDIRQGVKAYYQTLCTMITTQKPDIIAHMDKIKMHNGGRFFREDEPWYIALVDEALEVISRSECIVEINSRGIYKKRCPDLYPSLAILKKLNRMNVPITFSSDAHAPGELNLELDSAISIALEAGYREA
ncbi:MAG: histidinol-phosphatase, partial [Bacteroidota bacterium]|nr:histidinol-phosphatase [Bacteroidota bacterium]